MKTLKLVGSTNVSDVIAIRNKADSTPVTGIVFGDLTAYYFRVGAVAIEVPVVIQTVTGAHIDGGFVEIDSVNMPGQYRIDYPDTMFALGVASVFFQIKGHIDMNPVDIEIELTTFEVSDPTAVKRLPNIDEIESPEIIADATRLEMDDNSTKLIDIVADTNELQTNQTAWATADVSNLDVAVSTRSSHTANEVATSVWGFIVENGKSAMSHLIRIKSVLAGNSQSSGKEFMDDAGTSIETTVVTDVSNNRTFS